MELRNKYYKVDDIHGYFYFSPTGGWKLDLEELDRYISTLRSLREYLYE